MRGKELGRWGEEQAVNYLEKKGYVILERNYKNRLGEIDIVALDGEVLVFVEVKTRSSRDYGRPLEGVTWKKQRQLRRLALCYLVNSTLKERDIRFDVIGIERESEGRYYINHLKGIFSG